MIDKTIDWMARQVPRILMSAAAGIAFLLLGELLSQRWAKTVGGLLLMPAVIVLGVLCAIVVLLAPCWPVAYLMDKVPPRFRWPFMAAAVVCTFAWWAIWVSIALGDHSGR